MAQECISLAGSTMCPAFNTSSVSTTKALTDHFSFLSFVSDTQSFDDRLRTYISTEYSQQKYRDNLGCSSVNLTNTTDLYARYTTTVICNAIVQLSITPCSLLATDSIALCADNCAQFATSEQEIIASPEICGTAGKNAVDQIRSDFTVCSLPQGSLTKDCINAAANEPLDCGYQSNLQGLCSYCSASSPNSTDSCCVNSNVNSRCVGVHLPSTTSMPPLFTGTSTATSSPTGTTAAAAAGGNSHGLSGGAIAGIVIGSILGAALILAAVIFFCTRLRKRQDSQAGSVFNQPSPSRAAAGPPMTYNTDGPHAPPPSIVPGGRVARMSALEGTSSSSGNHSGGAAVAGIGAFRQERQPSPDSYNQSPDSNRSLAAGHISKRDGSLSSHSALSASNAHSSPNSGGDQFSSPEGPTSGQSEQLQFFKDYYSQDEIRPNDTVATLWAYAPRANDEFELERGDMLKVVGIWDDGWATGVKLTENAEQWEARRTVQRDSGVSNGSRRSGVAGESEIKAFPLVCVCLPQHWRKTIEGDTSDSGGANGPPPQPSP
ncbi:hypothetical protein BU16DRAFT_460265 [Lophium mytilinum]|uniref:SH3 domain-containing protein n=1 Tax=Lophium mytilinum TaxID=390894 RepID=A0A6A6QUK7_9PEZI|nr:hypothetical protein BU16DRAFT_460265 [Lophium mytilinum]